MKFIPHIARCTLCTVSFMTHDIIQMVTGLEGSIMECHPEGSLLPKAAGRGQQWSWGVLLFILFGWDWLNHGHQPLVCIIHLIWHVWANSRGQNSCFQQLTCWWCRLRHMVTEHAYNIVALLWRPSGPQSLVMMPAKMADRIMLPDVITRQSTNQERVFPSDV